MVPEKICNAFTFNAFVEYRVKFSQTVSDRAQRHYTQDWLGKDIEKSHAQSQMPTVLPTAWHNCYKLQVQAV